MEKHNDIFGQLIQSSFKIESTSNDFTEKVMSKIDTTAPICPTLKAPIISRKVWYIIALIYFVSFISIVLSGVRIDEWEFLYSLPFQIDNIPDFKKSFIIGVQFLFVLSSITLGDHLLKHRKLIV